MVTILATGCAGKLTGEGSCTDDEDRGVVDSSGGPVDSSEGAAWLHIGLTSSSGCQDMLKPVSGRKANAGEPKARSEKASH
mmetsp:Transcript_3095/g.5576  ORF Transcript_3095/g.5576 Transcript_3095/m.5576 type:complete len:81 (+) Transcript_3095:252-494(+)